MSSTSVTNASVAENNSPIPADRLYFRYNFFQNGQSVTGISGATTPFLVNGVPSAGGTLQSVPQLKNYNVHAYTFGGEKTFFDGLLSAELRVPVLNTLATDPRARVLYLSPTKALGHDQLRAAHALTAAIPRLHDVAPSAYDGDSPAEVRRCPRCERAADRGAGE